MYNHIVKAATEIAQNLQFDLEATRTLCSQLFQYKRNKKLFDIPFSYKNDNPITWWELIEPDQDYLQRVALYLLTICPNSVSCERGFLTLRWLIGKRRLRLSVERLELMTKLITYYRSNASKELAFYEKKMQELQIMEKVQLALAELVEDDDNNFPESEERRTTILGEIVSNNTVRVVIEPLWLDNLLNLNYKSIITSLGEIPIDDDFDLIDDNNTNNNENDDEKEEYVIGRDVLDYTADDLIAEFGEFRNIFFFFLFFFVFFFFQGLFFFNFFFFFFVFYLFFFFFFFSFIFIFFKF